MHKYTIMIDLDGVLNNYKKYDENVIPEMKHGADKFLQKLSEKYSLILFTTRNPEKASQWLIDNNLFQYFDDVTSIKSPAYIYLDDRAVQFNGDFDKALFDIDNFQVYWK